MLLPKNPIPLHISRRSTYFCAALPNDYGLHLSDWTELSDTFRFYNSLKANLLLNLTLEFVLALIFMEIK